MFDVFEILLMSAHLMLVDIAMVAPLLCVWLEWRETRYDDSIAGDLGRQLAAVINPSLMVGILFGAALLALRWVANDSAFFSSAEVIPRSRFWFGGLELAFFLACIALYRRGWDRWKKHRWAHRLLALAAATNLALHFPTLFAVISVIGTRSRLWGVPLDRAGYQQLLMDPEVIARVVHVWFAGVAIACLTLAVMARRHADRTGEQAAHQHIVTRSARLALLGVLFEIPVGLWLAWLLPNVARESILGEDLLATLFFAAAILATLGMLHTLAAVALGDPQRRQLNLSLAMLLITIVAMMGTRSRLHPPIALPAAQQAAIAFCIP